MSDKDNKIIGLRLSFRECTHGRMHLTNVEPIRESAVAYSAPDADAVLGGSTVGWSPTYAANWDANFGKQSTDDVN